MIERGEECGGDGSKVSTAVEGAHRFLARSTDREHDHACGEPLAHARLWTAHRDRESLGGLVDVFAQPRL